MTFKWIGALFIIISCGFCGYRIAISRKREIRTLRKLICVLDYMGCELQYKMSPLPDLCRAAAEQTDSILQEIFSALAIELENQVAPNVSFCMQAVLEKSKSVPKYARQICTLLGESLGRFDLIGQLKGLESVRNECNRMLEVISRNADNVLRSYQTLGLCAGAALVILLI